MSNPALHVPSGHVRGEQMSLPQRLLYSFIRAALAGVSRAYFRLEVHGRANIPASGPFILSPSHRSNLDTPLIGVVTKRRLRYMGKESLWKSKPFGWFLSTLGGFPVQRGMADREAMRASTEVLRRGEPLVMFPEGTRQTGPSIDEMRDGPAYVACRTGVPIVPVGLAGTEGAMPKGSKLIRPVKMVFVIGEPIVPPQPEPGTRVPRRVVRELTQELRTSIHAVFDEARERAGYPDGY
jgi:1-acyl-sn-glycerol-3-phosphate acyltransferase